MELPPNNKKASNSQRNQGSKKALLQTLFLPPGSAPQGRGVPFVSKDNMCRCGLLSSGLASTLVICVMCPLLCVMLREENQGDQAAKEKH